MIKKINYLPLCICILVLCGMVSFSYQRHKDKTDNDIKLIFETKAPLYLATNSVDKLLIQKKDSTSSQLKDTLALSKVENQIKAFAEVENAEVYRRTDGRLEVYIQERTPVVRILDEEGYYLDRIGMRMPLSGNYSPNVPLFYGALDSLQKPHLLQLLAAVENDEFLHRQVMQIEEDQGNFFLGLRDFSTRFELGDLSRLQGKIKKLKTLCAFLKQEQMEDKYKNINLKYQQQAVAIE